MHGSATNFSRQSRRFLLYQYRAADAWPLLGLKEGIEKFNEQLIVGAPSLEPRADNQLLVEFLDTFLEPQQRPGIGS